MSLPPGHSLQATVAKGSDGLQTKLQLIELSQALTLTSR